MQLHPLMDPKAQSTFNEGMVFRRRRPRRRRRGLPVVPVILTGPMRSGRSDRMDADHLTMTSLTSLTRTYHHFTDRFRINPRQLRDMIRETGQVSHLQSFPPLSLLH
jgi:hypothetical protein